MTELHNGLEGCRRSPSRCLSLGGLTKQKRENKDGRGQGSKTRQVRRGYRPLLLQTLATRITGGFTGLYLYPVLMPWLFWDALQHTEAAYRGNNQIHSRQLGTELPITSRWPQGRNSKAQEFTPSCVSYYSLGKRNALAVGYEL